MKQERCRVTERGRACGRRVVGTFQTDAGRVPVCAAHKADIDARVQAQIRVWAQQLARGAGVDDLTLPGDR